MVKGPMAGRRRPCRDVSPNTTAHMSSTSLSMTHTGRYGYSVIATFQISLVTRWSCIYA
uniref:Uncharacterized protein n=1 Tax=Zea mays TaxID=4577 RepID=B6U4K9_MAIZE|nr:hypothetical protein [Zea mays]